VPTSRATRVTSPAKVELVDHRVQRFLELKDLAANVDGDLARQVAVGDCGGDLGDVADLTGEVASHGIDVVGEVLSTSPQHLAPAPGRDHRVDGLFQLQYLAADVDGDFFR
jgi:hypothetical protein